MPWILQTYFCLPVNPLPSKRGNRPCSETSDGRCFCVRALQLLLCQLKAINVQHSALLFLVVH